MPKLPTIDEMLKAGMHFGHRTSKWHPKMGPYIYASRNNVHIIDLEKSKKLLETALDFTKKFSSESKIILLVGTKMQVKNPLKEVALKTGMPYVTEKWLGGTLTNFAIIKKLSRKYLTIKDDQVKGKFKKYTKKEQIKLDKEIKKLETKVGGLSNLNRLPDAIFVWDCKTEATSIAEAVKKNIPVIGVCDTNTNPKGINYLIPANDDATKSVKLILALLEEAIFEGKTEIKK